jgi:hypothetical protein
MRPLYLSSIVLAFLFPHTAFAQPQRYNPASTYGPFSRPALSPYLNLIRGGDPAANYYLGVVPERDRRANTVQFGAQLLDLEARSDAASRAAPEPDIPQLGATGHPAYFLNYSSYYNFAGAGRPAQPAAAPLRGQRRR